MIVASKIPVSGVRATELKQEKGPFRGASVHATHRGWPVGMPSPPSRSIVKRGKRSAAAAVSATQEIRQLRSYVDTAATEFM